MIRSLLQQCHDKTVSSNRFCRGHAIYIGFCFWSTCDDHRKQRCVPILVLFPFLFPPGALGLFSWVQGFRVGKLGFEIGFLWGWNKHGTKHTVISIIIYQHESVSSWIQSCLTSFKDSKTFIPQVCTTKDGTDFKQKLKFLGLIAPIHKGNYSKCMYTALRYLDYNLYTLSILVRLTNPDLNVISYQIILIKKLSIGELQTNFALKTAKIMWCCIGALLAFYTNFESVSSLMKEVFSLLKAYGEGKRCIVLFNNSIHHHISLMCTWYLITIHSGGGVSIPQSSPSSLTWILSQAYTRFVWNG